jgi:parallel beta-helix repeat protein
LIIVPLSEQLCSSGRANNQVLHSIFIGVNSMSKKKSRKLIMLLMLTFLVGSFLVGFHVGNASKTIVVPDNYLTINEAIERASPGDTIFVKSGIYYENLVVDKSLDLVGEDCKSTVVIGEGNIDRGEQAVFTISADQVKISDFTIKSQNYSTSSLYATGISVEGDNCVITENKICNTFYGIFCSVQSNITISKNQIVYNLKDGIRFCGGSYNDISENSITENAKGGIAIEGYSNKISRNNITNNSRGIGLGSSYSLVFGNNIHGNNEFNFFFAGSYNIVYSNNISDSTWGIYFSPYFAAPIQNKFYHNNFIDNQANVGSISSYNVQSWDEGVVAGGNYWSDYFAKYPAAKEGEDSGIGDIKYEIDTNNTDNYPLLAPFDILNASLSSPISPPTADPNGTVAFWAFDEVKPNGVTPDETGLNFAVVGTSSGNVSFTPILIDGKFGKALSFDGAAYVNTPILPHLEIPEETTIDVWINVQEFKNVKYNNIIVECKRTRAQLPERTFGLAVNGKTDEGSGIVQGVLLAFVSTENEGLNEIVTSESVITLNQWMHVVFTRSLSTGMHIYVNGEEKDVTVISGVQNPKGTIERETELYIGHDAVCLIDEMRLYNIALEPKSEQLSWMQLTIGITILSIVGAAFFFYLKVKH